MANYQSQYTGAQIDEAVGKALEGGLKLGGHTMTLSGSICNKIVNCSYVDSTGQHHTISKTSTAQTVTDVFSIKFVLNGIGSRDGVITDFFGVCVVNGAVQTIEKSGTFYPFLSVGTTYEDGSTPIIYLPFKSGTFDFYSD